MLVERGTSMMIVHLLLPQKQRRVLYLITPAPPPSAKIVNASRSMGTSPGEAVSSRCSVRSQGAWRHERPDLHLPEDMASPEICCILHEPKSRYQTSTALLELNAAVSDSLNRRPYDLSLRDLEEFLSTPRCCPNPPTPPTHIHPPSFNPLSDAHTSSSPASPT